MSTAPKTQFSGPDLCKMSAHEVVAFLKAKKVSPAEFLDACFARIAAVEPQVNAMPTICKDRGLCRAVSRRRRKHVGRRADGDQGLDRGRRRAHHDGNAFGLADQIPTTSDPLVTRLEANGGIVVGKTNTPEFGAGGNTFNAVFGRTRNPWDVSKNAGGSSGGAAASLASGEVWLSHGSDLAGSVRTPAAYCGIVGLRPSPGRAGGGPGPMKFHTEGVQGPMARNVRGLRAFHGRDVRF